MKKSLFIYLLFLFELIASSDLYGQAISINQIKSGISYTINNIKVNNQAKYAYLLLGCVNNNNTCCDIKHKKREYVNKSCLRNNIK